jgi:hypothetical protein
VPDSHSDNAPYSYAILRVVPDLERGESLNVGVVLFCAPRRYLDAAVALDEERLQTLSPGAQPEAIRSQLDAALAIAHGEDRAGRVAELSQAERFGLLVAPSSTIVQPSPVHTGLTADPAETLRRIFVRLVAI